MMTPAPFSASAFSAGLLLSLSLIMAIGPQNAHLLRMGLQRQHLWLTVAVCALADAALILLGVFGLARLGGLSPKLNGALIGAGVVFLIYYCWQALQRAWRAPITPAPVIDTVIDTASDPVSGVDAAQRPQPAPLSRKQAVAAAMAFSVLNPHAWIDTAMLIGTASLAYRAPGHALFGLGAVTGSLIWFVGFGALVCWLGHRLRHARLWQWLDAVVAIMMGAIAVVLIASLWD